MTQERLPFARAENYHIDDFLVKNANREAWQLIQNNTNEESSVARFISIYGAKGSGKTHLAHIFASLSGAKILNITDIGKSPSDDILGDSKYWVIDDIENINNEEGLFHLINAIKAKQGCLLITTQSHLTQLNIKLPDLQSRLASFTAIALHQPDDDLLHAVLVKLFSDRQLRVSDEVYNYILKRVERSFAAIQQLVENLDQASMTQQRNITLPLVRKLI